jgi:gliding motility-associated protein GldL
MFTECVIFFFSAFEPLPAEYHWETIYPELSGDNPNLEEGGSLSRGGTNNARDRRLGQSGVELSIDQESADNLKKSVERFNQTMNSLNALSTIGDSSQQFVAGLQRAAGNMNTLNEAAQIFANTYRETTQSVVDVYRNTTQTVSNTSQQFVSGLQQAAGNMNTLSETAQTFANTYRETAQTVVDVYRNTTQTVSDHSQQANANLVALNQNLQAVNTSYELYLQEHREYVAHSKTLLGAMDNSAQQSQLFDQQMIKLNKLIAELNTAYTSVVQTVNATLKRK